MFINLLDISDNFDKIFINSKSVEKVYAIKSKKEDLEIGNENLEFRKFRIGFYGNLVRNVKLVDKPDKYSGELYAG
jgi:hypothetical protein